MTLFAKQKISHMSSELNQAWLHITVHAALLERSRANIALTLHSLDTGEAVRMVLF